MTRIANEISQFRNFGKDPKVEEEFFKELFSLAKIKTKDN